MSEQDRTDRADEGTRDEARNSAESRDHAGPVVVSTVDPAIDEQAERREGWRHRPDGTNVVETSHVARPMPLEPQGVHVAPTTPRQAPAKAETPSAGDEPHHRPLWKLLLMVGVVAAVCGIAGAWGYSHFFGPKPSEDSSNKGSDSKSAALVTPKAPGDREYRLRI